MNEQAKAPVVVEVYLDGCRIQGLSRRVEERRRLVDVLNTQEDVFELEVAKFTPANGGEPRYFPSIAIQKRALLIAIPHETDEQIRLRNILSTGIGRAATNQVSVALYLAPFYIEGMAHITAGVGKMRVDAATLPRFFPLTSAKLMQQDGVWRECDVLLVNRDAVMAFSQLT